MEISTEWSELKSFAIARNLSIQWILTNNTYFLWAIDGPVEISTQIRYANPTPDNSDQFDFETNFKPKGNVTVKTKMIQELGADSFNIYPFGILFTAPLNKTTEYDYKIPFNVFLKGCAMLSSPGTIGDYISSIEVVDKDNILGLGEGIVLGSYLNNWYVFPNMKNQVEDISLSQEVFANLYLRVIYVNVSLSLDTQVVINFIAYQAG